MNTGKSMNKALVDKEVKKKDWAVRMDVSRQTVSNWCRRKEMAGKELRANCKELGMLVSVFIALGE